MELSYLHRTIHQIGPLEAKSERCLKNVELPFPPALRLLTLPKFFQVLLGPLQACNRRPYMNMVLIWMCSQIEKHIYLRLNYLWKTQTW